MLTFLEHDVAVRDIGRHGVGGDFSRAGAGKDALYFWKLFFELGFELHLHLYRLREAGARNAQRLNGKVTFVQVGCKLAAHARGQQQAQGHDNACSGQHDGWGLQSPVQQGCIGAARPDHDAVFFLCHFVTHEQGDGGRHKGDGQQHGAEQGDDHGQRHGVEHFPFDPGQRKNRQVHHHDDELTKQQRAARFSGRFKHFVQAFVAGQWRALGGLGVGQAAHAVLHNHHRTVDDDAKVQRAQAHEVGADAPLHHAGKGEQHGQWNDEGGDQRGAQIAQEQEQHGHHQCCAFDQIFLDRGDGFVDQVGAVVDRHRFDASGQVAVDVLHAAMHSLRYGAAVFANQHEDGTEYDFAAVVGGGAGAQLATQADFCQIAHTYRLALTAADNDFADIGHALHLARCANQVLLALALDVAGAHIAVVALQRGDDVGHGKAIGGKLFWQWGDQIFLGKAANGVDLGDARHIAQLGLDDPVLNFAQIHGRIRRAIGLFGVVFGLYGPQVDFTQAGRDRA